MTKNTEETTIESTPEVVESKFVGNKLSLEKVDVYFKKITRDIKDEYESIVFPLYHENAGMNDVLGGLKKNSRKLKTLIIDKVTNKDGEEARDRFDFLNDVELVTDADNELLNTTMIEYIVSAGSTSKKK